MVFKAEVEDLERVCSHFKQPQWHKQFHRVGKTWQSGSKMRMMNINPEHVFI